MPGGSYNAEHFAFLARPTPAPIAEGIGGTGTSGRWREIAFFAKANTQPMLFAGALSERRPLAASHGGNRGSNLLGDANEINILDQNLKNTLRAYGKNTAKLAPKSRSGELLPWGHSRQQRVVSRACFASLRPIVRDHPWRIARRESDTDSRCRAPHRLQRLRATKPDTAKSSPYSACSASRSTAA